MTDHTTPTINEVSITTSQSLSHRGEDEGVGVKPDEVDEIASREPDNVQNPSFREDEIRMRSVSYDEFYDRCHPNSSTSFAISSTNSVQKQTENTLYPYFILTHHRARPLFSQKRTTNRGVTTQ
jgi:hypothetical protein